MKTISERLKAAIYHRVSKTGRCPESIRLNWERYIECESYVTGLHNRDNREGFCIAGTCPMKVYDIVYRSPFGETKILKRSLLYASSR